MPEAAVNKAQPQYTELGSVGLQHWGGVIQEEFLTELRGTNKLKIYRQMKSNSPVVAAMLRAISWILQSAKWSFEPNTAKANEAADFLEECREDMDHSWADFLSEALSFLWTGWDLHEVIFKRREDGTVGWRKFAFRAQDTVDRWEFDDKGVATDFWQVAPPNYKAVKIPLSRCLHLRLTTEKGNPEGDSVLRSAYQSFYFARNIQAIEGIGVERDLAGIPVFYIGNDVSRNPDDPKSMYHIAKEVGRNLRRDEQECVVIPAAKMGSGAAPGDGVLLELLSSGGKREFDTGAIISRYETRMAMSVLAQWLMLGMNSIGSYALSQDQSDFFRLGLEGTITTFCEQFNKQAVDRLLAVNPHINAKDKPKMVGKLSIAPDYSKFANAVNQLVQAQVLDPTDMRLRARVMDVMGLPAPIVDLTPTTAQPLPQPNPAQTQTTTPPAAAPPAPTPPEAPVTMAAKESVAKLPQSVEKYSEDQPRDGQGRFGGGSGGGSTSGIATAAGAPWKMTRTEYLKQNPHSGGALTGNSKAFDALPDDAEVIVFHATNEHNAALLTGEQTGTPELQGGGINSQSNALYVGADPVSVSGYGKEIVALRVHKSQLIKSPEAKNKTSVGAALVDASAGANLVGKPLGVMRIHGDPYVRAHEALVREAVNTGQDVPAGVLSGYGINKQDSKEKVTKQTPREEAMDAYREEMVGIYDEWSKEQAKKLDEADPGDWAIIIAAGLLILGTRLKNLAWLRLPQAFLMGAEGTAINPKDLAAMAAIIVAVKAARATGRAITPAEWATLTAGTSISVDNWRAMVDAEGEYEDMLDNRLLPEIGRVDPRVIAIGGAAAMIAALGALTYRIEQYAGPYWRAVQLGAGTKIEELGNPRVRRVLQDGAIHCNTCPDKAGEYDSWDDMVSQVGLPSDGSDFCGGHCLCYVLYWDGEDWVDLAGANVGKSADVKKKLAKYSEDQPRDEQGRFGGGGSAGSAGAGSAGAQRNRPTLTLAKMPESDWAEYENAMHLDSPDAAGMLARAGNISPEEARARIDAARIEAAGYPSTRDQHLQADGSYTPERQALHDKIQQDLLANSVAPGEGEQPTLLLTGGLPGAGKSSMLRGKEYDDIRDKVVMIDSDDIKGRLAQADGIDNVGTHAASYHPEADDIVASTMAAALSEGRSIGLDGTMKSGDKMASMVEQFKARGYRVEVAFAHLPIQKAMERAVGRYLQGGRFVDPKYIATHDAKNIKTARVLKGKADVVRIWNTDVPYGSSPTLSE